MHPWEEAATGHHRCELAAQHRPVESEVVRRHHPAPKPSRDVPGDISEHWSSDEIVFDEAMDVRWPYTSRVDEGLVAIDDRPVSRHLFTRELDDASSSAEACRLGVEDQPTPTVQTLFDHALPRPHVLPMTSLPDAGIR